MEEGVLIQIEIDKKYGGIEYGVRNIYRDFIIKNKKEIIDTMKTLIERLEQEEYPF